ncbi:MAG TPA: hypothetical protein VK835_09230, partial [Bacteroidia bacterium]|nr:hypothetical protein [Bacteroidia bacterium]
MKTISKLFFIAIVISIVSCKKDIKTAPPTPAAASYNTIWDFFPNMGVALQVYTINAGTGGSFTSPQGTSVTIPANAFLTSSHVPVTGNVIIQFKDIYKKSDMFLENMPTQLYNSAPLKSGGEFFINPIQNNASLILASGKKITVSQPASLTGGVNAAFPQQAYLWKDTIMRATNCTVCPQYMAIVPIWSLANTDTVQTIAQNYIFSLYPRYDSSSTTNNSGTWCNSDNASYFAS